MLIGRRCGRRESKGKDILRLLFMHTINYSSFGWLLAAVAFGLSEQKGSSFCKLLDFGLMARADCSGIGFL